MQKPNIDPLTMKPTLPQPPETATENLPAEDSELFPGVTLSRLKLIGEIVRKSIASDKGPGPQTNYQEVFIEKADWILRSLLPRMKEEGRSKDYFGSPYDLSGMSLQEFQDIVDWAMDAALIFVTRLKFALEKERGESKS